MALKENSHHLKEQTDGLAEQNHYYTKLEFNEVPALSLTDI